MDPPPTVGDPAVAHLCDVILDTLRVFGNAAADFIAFRGEVQTLRKFLDLIERIRQANAPRTPFEDEHFSDLEALLGRCRETLSRLCEILSDIKARYHKAAPQDALQQTLRSLQNSETAALRARIGFYVQCLQMSLHVVRLVYQWKSQLPQDGITYHQKALSESIQVLKKSISCVKGLTQRSTPWSPYHEEAFLYDIEKCLFSAEVIMSVTTTTTYDNPQFLQMPSELPAEEFLVDSQIPDLPNRLMSDSPKIYVPQSRDRTPDRSPQPQSRDPSPLPPPITTRKPVAQRHIAEAAIRPKGSNPALRPKGSNPALRPKAPTPTSSTPPPEKPILFHIDDINPKRRGSLDSDNDSIFDPEPEFEDRFPDAVYSQLIAGLQQEARRALESGDYQQAEESHCKAMEYLTDRERKLGVSFDKAEMNEVLAQIYWKQKQLNKAKKVLNRLLMEEKEDTPRKWRLYHALADIYQDQDRLTEAEKFARRAYIGREKSLEKHDVLLLQSVDLLINIYERQHKMETADALRKVYQAYSPPPQVPPKSRQRDRSSSQVQPPQPPYPMPMEVGPPVQPQLQHQAQPPPQYQPQYQTHSPVQPQSQYPPHPLLNSQPQSPLRSQAITPFSPDEIAKSHMRWAPDAWVDSSSINAPTKSGETPLIAAINTRDEELVKLMLQRGADVEARCVDQMAPLMHAVCRGSQTIVEILLNKGAQVDAPTAGWTVLHKAAHMVNIPITKMLLVGGADIEARSPKDFLPKKHPLARGGDLDDYDEVDPADADIGYTPLLRAATHGHEAMVRLLLDRGANIEARTPSNGTPLICACEGNHEAIVDFLLTRGADVNVSDEFGWRPLHRTLVTRGGERIAQMLLSHNAYLDARCNFNKTPLHHAVEKGNEPMASFLLRAGADVEARDIADRTPLHTAIEARISQMVRVLLEAGADAEAKDSGGRDALSVAQHAPRKSPEVIGLLSKHKREAKKAKRGSVGSRQTSISEGSGSRGSIAKSSNTSVSKGSSSSGGWWGSMRGKKEKK
ncbi:hypothetical protein ACLMJK_002812 [Lecanora helva]